MGEALLLLSNLMFVIHKSIADKIEESVLLLLVCLKHLSVDFYARIKVILF